MNRVARKTAFLAIGQVAILVIMLLSNRIVYATNDDTTMIALASGGYGSPSPYIINMHIALGYGLKFLFTLWPQINWITVFYLTVYVMGVLALDFTFARRKRGISFFVAAVVIDLSFLIVLGYFTFTVLAFWAGIVGFVLLTDSIKFEQGKCRFWMGFLGFIMTVLAALIRGEAIKSLLIVYSAVIVIEFVLHKNAKPIFLAIVAACLMVCSIQSNTWMMNQNPTQKRFYDWGETRSAALDCQAVPYDEKVFNEKGITQVQYQAIYGAFYYDFDSVNKGVMKTVIELNDPANKYNFDLAGFLKSYFASLTNIYCFDFFYKLLFGAVLLLYIIYGPREMRLFAFLIWLTVLLNEFVFYFINRPLYRVIMPGYLFATFLLLVYGDIHKKEDSLRTEAILALLTVVLAFTGCIEFTFSYKDYQPWLYSEQRKAVLEYMYDHTDKIYMAGEPGVFSIGVSDSIWNHPERNGGWNLIGNWETYSVPYLELMKSHGVTDPYHILREAINSEDILLLTRLGDSFPERSQWILDLVYELYGVKVDFRHIEDISKVTDKSENPTLMEDWMVYQLIEIG